MLCTFQQCTGTQLHSWAAHGPGLLHRQRHVFNFFNIFPIFCNFRTVPSWTRERDDAWKWRTGEWLASIWFSAAAQDKGGRLKISSSKGWKSQRSLTRNTADLDWSGWTPLERMKYQNRALFMLLGEDMGEMGICVFLFLLYISLPQLIPTVWNWVRTAIFFWQAL